MSQLDSLPVVIEKEVVPIKIEAENELADTNLDAKADTEPAKPTGLFDRIMHALTGSKFEADPKIELAQTRKQIDDHEAAALMLAHIGTTLGVAAGTAAALPNMHHYLNDNAAW